MIDDLHLIGGANVTQRARALFDGRLRKEFAIFARIEDTLYAAVEFRGQIGRIGGNSHTQVGVEPQQIGWQEGRSGHALAMLRWHGYHQTTDASLGEGLQDSIVALVKGLNLQKGIDRTRKIKKGV